MGTQRTRSELVAWVSGAGLGAIIGIPLGMWSTPVLGIVVGVTIGVLVALSIRRGRGTRGWSDTDGASTLGEGGSSDTIPRPFVKGSPSSADLPVTPGLGGAAGSSGGSS